MNRENISSKRLESQGQCLQVSVEVRGVKDGYPDLTEDEYKELFKNMIDELDNIRMLRYFYVLVSKLIQAWS